MSSPQPYNFDDKYHHEIPTHKPGELGNFIGCLFIVFLICIGGIVLCVYSARHNETENSKKQEQLK
jgi:hypothetical protein